MRQATTDDATNVLVGGMNPDEIYKRRAQEVQRWKDTLPARSHDEIRSGACQIGEFDDEFYIQGVKSGSCWYGVSIPKTLIQNGAQTGQGFFSGDVKAHFEGRGMSNQYYIVTAPFYIHLFSTLRRLLDVEDPEQKVIAENAQQTLKRLIEDVPLHTLTEVQYCMFGDIIINRRYLYRQSQTVLPLKGLHHDVTSLESSRAQTVCQMLRQADLETLASSAALFTSTRHGRCRISSLKQLENPGKESIVPLTLTYTKAGLQINIEDSHLGAGLGIRVFGSDEQEVLP